MQPFWKRKRVFITGATGFVGSWLAKALIREDAHIVALVRDFNPENGTLSCADLRFMDLVPGKLEDFHLLERILNEYEIDTVFHLGAQALVEVAFKSPLQTFESNIRGTYNLLEACRLHARSIQRILIASSDKAYGTSSILPYTEETPLAGRSPYDVSKSCTDLIALSYSLSYSLPIVIARCGNIFGGGDFHWSRIIPGTIRKLLEGERPLIRSDGKFTRDYLYVKDAVKAYMLIAMRSDQPSVQGQAFNFGPAKSYTVLEIVEELRKIVGKTNLKPIILNKASGEIRDQLLDSEKAKNLLGWTPDYSLNTALQETVEWYRQHLHQQHPLLVAGAAKLRAKSL